MRSALAISVAILTLGLSYGSVLAQIQPGEPPALELIRMIDPLSGWAVTREPDANELLRTIDGGIHWRDVTPHAPPGQKIAVGEGSAFLVDWLNSLVAWMVAPVHAPTHDTALLFHTVDGGETWKSLNPPVVGLFDFINVRVGWMLAGNDIYRSTDAGETWTKIASAEFPGGYSAITFLNTTTGWVTPGSTDDPERISPYVTHDGGSTWRRQKLSLPPGEVPFRVAIPRPPTFFTARDGVFPVPMSHFVFYMTHDSGATWIYATPVAVTQWGPFSFADVNHGWLVDGDALHVTSDGGHLWTTMQPAPPFAQVPVGEVDFISPHVGWASGRPLFPPALLKTQDGGHTWAPVSYTIVRK